jgi:hypothetical protein
MRFAPDKGVHAAHRCAHDQSKVGDAELLQHQPLGLDHVVIIIFRELQPQPIGRLRRLSMADIVGKDDPVAADIERLARAIEFIGELGPKKLLAAASRAVEHHDRIVDLSRSVAVRRAKRRVVHTKAAQRLPGSECKFGQRDVALSRRPADGGGGGRLRCGRSLAGLQGQS